MRRKKIVFICSIAGNVLKVVSCRIFGASRREFIGMQVRPLLPGLDDDGLARELEEAFKQLKRRGEPVIVSLPRQHAIVRYLSVPTAVPEEIEKIISLQAGRFSPYPVHELVSGYQVISSEERGGSRVSVVIAHKEVISRFLRLFRALKIREFSIVPSSWGLSSLSRYCRPQESAPALIADIDPASVEFVIGSRDKVLFSRSSTIELEGPRWREAFLEEAEKTVEAYAREIQGERPGKMLVVSSIPGSKRISALCTHPSGMPVEELRYWEHIHASKSFSEQFCGEEVSLAGLIGLGVRDIPASLTLLPQEEKEAARKAAFRKDASRIAVIFCAAAFVFAAAFAIGVKAKERHARRLRLELSRIEGEARGIEMLERKIDFLKAARREGGSVLEILHELHRVIPKEVSLVNFIFEDPGTVVLRGQTPELNSVFTFVSRLENSSAFKRYDIKLKYVTKKNAGTGDTIDFEIDCGRGK